MKSNLKLFEVVDVELAHIFYTDTETAAQDAKVAIELVGHRAIIKEIEQKVNYAYHD
jgi:hypothetical protein